MEVQEPQEMVCNLCFTGKAKEAFPGERNHLESHSELVVKAKPDPEPQTTTAVPLPPRAAACW